MSDRYQSRNGYGSRTTRGLNRVPPSSNYERPSKKQTPKASKASKSPKKRVRKKVKIKERLFGLGIGLDMQLLLLVLLLLGIGLSTLFSASYSDAYYQDGSSFEYIQKQGIFAVVGIILMLGISTFNYNNFKKKWCCGVLLFVTIVMLGVVIVLKGTAFVPTINGANRWINIGGISIQPSEMAKFMSIMMISMTLSKYDGKDVPFLRGVVPCFFWFGLFAVLVVLEPHVSATIIIAFICSAVMLSGGVKLRWFLLIGVPAAVGGVFYILFSGKFAHVMPRILGWLNPFNPPDGVDTYQTRQSLYAIGSGGLFGTGIGQSKLKHIFLPEPQNDFVFAIFCEEMGLAGALVVILLFLWLVWRGINISIHAKDRFGTLLGIGITFTIGIQAAANICVVTNAFPNTGISLPFFSYGGSSLLVLLSEMGVLLSISRYNYRQDAMGIPEKTLE